MTNSIYSCMKCGTCTGACPSGRVVAFRTRKIVEDHCNDEVDLDDEALWYCTTCYNCMERCPRHIDITDDILSLREQAYRAGKALEPHIKVLGYLKKTGHAVSLSEKVANKREALGLPRKPPTTHSYEDALDEVRRILEEEGVSGE